MIILLYFYIVILFTIIHSLSLYIYTYIHSLTSEMFSVVVKRPMILAFSAMSPWVITPWESLRCSPCVASQTFLRTRFGCSNIFWALEHLVGVRTSAGSWRRTMKNILYFRIQKKAASQHDTQYIHRIKNYYIYHIHHIYINI